MIVDPRTIALVGHGNCDCFTQNLEDLVGGWTRWRRIANKREWFDAELDWDGPACYELAIAGPRGGDMRIVYVGETINERRRVADYARSGSHLADIVARHLAQDWNLFYRARAHKSKAAARRMQDAMLKRWDYDWNLLLNGD